MKVSFAISLGVKLGSNFCFDQTRPGIGLYGIDNFGKNFYFNSEKLKLPLKLYAPVIQIKKVGDINLVELDNGIILTPPEGKEYGWVPIALGAETPYGKWQTELDFLYTEDAGLGTIADY